MNILSVDLNALAKKVNDNRLSASELQLIDRILFYHSKKENVEAEIVMVLGNPTCMQDRIIKGVEIARDSNAKYILVSGGVIIPGLNETEAVAMYNYCLETGISSKRILVENKSTTTRENIIFAAAMISKLALKHPHIVVVSSATHIRRVSMNCEQFKDLFPFDTIFDFACSIHPSCDPSKWFLSAESRNIVASEIQLIETYLADYGYAPFDV